jgi:hypothetical protein
MMKAIEADKEEIFKDWDGDLEAISDIGEYVTDMLRGKYSK